jgi:hypothetical protein
MRSLKSAADGWEFAGFHQGPIEQLREVAAACLLYRLLEIVRVDEFSRIPRGIESNPLPEFLHPVPF